MKSKKWFFGLIAIIAVITIPLVIVGLIFGKSDVEKQNGLSGHFDVTDQGTIAYIHYQDGKPEIRLYHPDQAQDTSIVQLETDQVILEPTFSHDGSMITYIVSSKNLEEELQSSVRQYHLESGEEKLLFSAPAAITEIEFSPNEQSLFYLKAGVFQNYSPIASKRPHDFDVHEYIFAQDEHIQHTNVKEYDMGSLQVADDGKSVFVQMGEEVEPAPDDYFDIKQRIFEIPLNEPENMKVVSDPDREVDIWGFTLVPNRQEMILQSIANHDEGGTFQYELYHYDMETKEEKQLTQLKEYAGNPVVIPESNKIYFTVDLQFAKQNSDYRLYRMNIDGTEMEEISLFNLEEKD